MQDDGTGTTPLERAILREIGVLLSPATHQRIVAVLEDPTTHYWLRDVLMSALKLDPVDVLNDIDVLKELLEATFNDIVAAHYPSA